MLGYSYALSAGGHFVGKTILGNFFLQNRDSGKQEAQQAALPYFREFAAMVRPVESGLENFQGTVDDGLLFLCARERAHPWALTVFVKTPPRLHAVLIPVFENPSFVGRFLQFLKDDEETLEIRPCQFEDGAWKVAPGSRLLRWPKTGVLYP